MPNIRESALSVIGDKTPVRQSAEFGAPSMEGLGMRRSRSIKGIAAAGAVLALLAGCGGGEDASGSEKSDKAAANEPASLTINVFGDSFPKELYAEYEKDHPGITIKENRADYGTHHNNLQARLAAGSGTADIEAIEIGQIAGFIGQADKFVNFRDEKVDTSQWNDAKVQQASTPDGQSLIGLGTDIGGLAICYRADLFEQAGLPTAREEVAALWPTWEDYVATGTKFLEKAPKGTKWMDGAGHLFTGILGQEKETSYDAEGNVIVADNPVVKSAWDLAVKAIKADQSAALAEFSPEWNTGFQRRAVRHHHLPGLDDRVHPGPTHPRPTGKWDIAEVPGGARQLGRLVPHGAQGRARTWTRRSSW